MSHRIAVIEDDAEIADFVVQGLREEGFHVDPMADGHVASIELRHGTWDLIVLDWWLPGPDGITLLKQVRASGSKTPILFLTARDAVAQRVEALNAGADDYLCKPFAFEELLARVRALLRRPPSQDERRWTYRDVTVDLTLNKVVRGDSPLNLTARELSLLIFFLRHPGEVLSRTRLYEQVWDERYDGLSNTLEVHVMELRRKLEVSGPRIIQTVRGRGYVLGEPTAEDAS